MTDTAAPAATDATPLALTLRSACDEDIPFLRELYATTREAELAMTEWTDDEKQAFLDHQFEAQLRDYFGRYEQRRFYVATVEHEAIGRLFLGDVPGGVCVVDLCVMPAHQGRGFGTTMLTFVLDGAAARGEVVSLYVDRWNAARTLYERLGFEVCDDGDADDEISQVYLRMEAQPRPIS